MYHFPTLSLSLSLPKYTPEFTLKMSKANFLSSDDIEVQWDMGAAKWSGTLKALFEADPPSELPKIQVKSTCLALIEQWIQHHIERTRSIYDPPAAISQWDMDLLYHMDRSRQY